MFVFKDFNGLNGRNADGYEGVHGGKGFGICNLEGERILKFAIAHNLIVSNSLFTKRKSSPGNLLVCWKSKSNWLHPGQATEHQIKAWCEIYPK